MKFLDLESNQ